MEPNGRYEFDETFCPQETLLSLTETLPTPFYLYDERGLRESVRRLFRAFSWNRGYRQYFPVHLLPLPEILKLFREERCGALCSTEEELRLASACGYAGDHLLFAPLVLHERAVCAARELGATVSMDNPAAAMACLERAPERVSFCCNPGGVFRAGTSAVRAERCKRGMTERQILEYVPCLMRAGALEAGLELHLPMQAVEPAYCAAAARYLLTVADNLRTCGVSASFCNLGEGPGYSFLPGEPNVDWMECGQRVKAVLEADFPGVEMPLWTTVGRLLTGEHGILAARVLGVKHTERNFAILDADAPQFPRILGGAYHHISVLGRTQKSNRSYWDVVGYLPQHSCRFGERRLLPAMEEGDICLIHDAAVEGPGVGCGTYLYREDGSVTALDRWDPTKG